MNRRRFALVVTVAAAVLSVAGVGIYFSPKAQPGTTQPPIAWAPAQLVVTLAPGNSKTVQVTANIKSTVPAILAEVVPALAPYVTIQPANMGASGAGAQQTFTLAFSIAAGTPFQTVNGTLHLRAGTDTVARPLPVVLNVWPSVTAGGSSFNYPTAILDAGGSLGQPTVSQVGADTLIDVHILTPADGLQNAFAIMVSPNASRLTLHDWFVQNIDPNSILLTAGTYQTDRLLDGRELLVARGPVPPQFGDVVSAAAFFTSPSGDQVASITLSQDQRLDLVGFGTDASHNELFRTVIETFIFPK